MKLAGTLAKFPGVCAYTPCTQGVETRIIFPLDSFINFGDADWFPKFTYLGMNIGHLKQKPEVILPYGLRLGLIVLDGQHFKDKGRFQNCYIWA